MKFKKYNANPLNKVVNDCSIRALSLALNKSWDDVLKDLCKIALKLKVNPTEIKAINEYLKDFEKVGQRVIRGERRLKVDDLSKNKTYILYMANHLTILNKGVLIDTWDCRNKPIYSYWCIGGINV